MAFTVTATGGLALLAGVADAARRLVRWFGTRRLQPQLFAMLLIAGLAGLAAGVGREKTHPPCGAVIVVPLELHDVHALAALRMFTAVVPDTVWSELAPDRSALLTLASIVHFSARGAKLALHAWLFIIVLSITAPITTIVLARAAPFRRHQEGDSYLHRCTAAAAALNGGGAVAVVQ